MVRIELDDEMEKELDAVKAELRLYGKGHTNTIAGLVEHFKQTRAIEKVVEKQLDKIPQNITNSFQKCAANFAHNLFKNPET